MPEQERVSLVNRTSAFVRHVLLDAEAGHNWSHIERVHRNALRILQEEKDADAEIVELAALLHDIADAKFHNGDEEKGPSLARDFLIKEGLDEVRTQHVCNIIRHMSFGGGNERLLWSSREMEIVQDADRLDAIGAIGIARAFHFGGFRNRPLFDPQIPPRLDMKKEEYRNSVSPTLNHFYEKLLLLKDRMNTETASKIAASRHKTMEDFLAKFLSEWEG